MTFHDEGDLPAEQHKNGNGEYTLMIPVEVKFIVVKGPDMTPSRLVQEIIETCQEVGHHILEQSLDFLGWDKMDVRLDDVLQEDAGEPPEKES